MTAIKARVLIVDDHPLVRDSLDRLINRQEDLFCCGEAGTVAEAYAGIARLKPELVILDLRLRDCDGIELIKSLKAQHPDLKILVLSQYEAPLYAERALRAGAVGYVVKEQAAEEILGAIRTVLSGEVYLTVGLSALLLNKFVRSGVKAPASGVERLSDRELHVLQLLGAGLSTRQIATRLNLSFKTIETHRENIKRRLGLRGAAELIHYANEWAREPMSVQAERTVNHR
jgi:DNA-binding NarL/FixJ family response regulator